MSAIARRASILAVSLTLGWAGWKGLNALLLQGPGPAKGEAAVAKIRKSEAEWKAELSPEAYRVMFQCGTEPPFSGRYNDFWEPGTYLCGACGTALFDSETKYEHGTGWPSFKAALDASRVVRREDRSHGLVRTEVRCANCGAHLGHVFDDGPPPTREHYCINSAALRFVPRAEASRRTAVFAAGCFWGVEYKFAHQPGVLETTVGYTGGTTESPTYADVCTDRTGHAEAVRVTFDPATIGYEELVRKFFSFHDPTQLNRQGPDVGTQYRSVIFYHDEEQRRTAEKVKAELEESGAFRGRIVTQIVPASTFTEAEEYHQKYYEKKGIRACGI